MMRFFVKLNIPKALVVALVPFLIVDDFFLPLAACSDAHNHCAFPLCGKDSIVEGRRQLS